MEYGTCHICLENKKLSFEHFPPKSCFNEGRVEIRGEISQKGIGGYTLCEGCNNNSGSWYVPSFEKVATFIGQKILYQKNVGLYKGLIDCNINVNMLYFTKQALTILCSITPIEQLKLLNIKNILINKNKFLSNNDENFEIFIGLHDDYINNLYMQRESWAFCDEGIYKIYAYSIFPFKLALINTTGIHLDGMYSLNKFLKYSFLRNCFKFKFDSKIKCFIDYMQ